MARLGRLSRGAPTRYAPLPAGTQTPRQKRKPGSQVGRHAPAMHAAPPWVGTAQARQEAPQWVTSDSPRQAPPQRWKPAAQVNEQAPEVQSGVAFAGGTHDSQSFPQLDAS